ncbi:MAG: YeeE/YedE family protein [Beijerinckiaceae bacterium]|nr:YeeE/YedE family protein [Beijerinckiaceae bacterium]
MLLAQKPLAILARPPALAAVAATLLLIALAGLNGGARMVVLAGIGVFAGLALYHASFGFTAAWRRFILERKSAGLRAQLIMLGVASLVFFPALAAGSLLGQPVGGYVFPVGVALVTGAFLFGLGMQLGGGCGSGTLFTIGGGSVRMVVTLVFFILGSTLASAYAEHWFAWPKFAPVSVVYSLGWLPALAAMIVGLAALYALVTKAETARHGSLASIRQPATQWLTGPWALIVGALALALVNIATLIVSGWPWGITGAFALWGAKIASLFGAEPATWAFFAGNEAALRGSLFTDVTSVMDFGIILGAMLAAMLAGKFKPGFSIPARSLAAAVIGGLLLGVGARLGTGCNIGAFFSGTVSGSLHGWVWLAFAFAGNVVGVKLRPLFKLD